MRFAKSSRSSILATVYFGQRNPLAAGKLVKPAAVESDHGLLAVEDLEYLRFVSLGVCGYLLRGHGRARGGAPGGIADQPGEVADQEDHGVAEVLEVFQLADQDGVAQVDVRRRGVETRLDPERLGS